MAQSSTFTVPGLPGYENLAVWIEYTPGNRRISDVTWTIPAGLVVRVKVWDDGVLVVDRTETADGAENVPGNYRMVEDVDEDGVTIYLLPPELTYHFEVEKL